MGPDYGRIAYEAYCGKTDWKSLVSGAALPQWNALKPEIRDAWDVAAAAVVEAHYQQTGRPG